MFGGLFERYVYFGITARCGLAYYPGNPVKVPPYNPPC